jgi:pyruvate formate lyase activating enzyme
MSETLGLCLNCIRTRPDQALRLAQLVHAESRRVFDLPAATPQASSGLQCVLCSRQCRIAESGRGYCGLHTVRDGRLTHLAGTARRGILQWYRDPLPTNCVADWVCSGNRRLGYHNLAVFYASCTLNCLFCQNWHFREISATSSAGISAEQLADAADPSTFCVCFFGGDPASQMPHALAAGQRLAAKGVTVCWETAGTSHPKLLNRAVELSLASGGCIKFDLKTYDESLHIVLTGGSNRQTLDNFARAAACCEERPDPPLVVASTLLVPGYVDAEEVGKIAQFIAALNRRIPYALLAFSPHFYMLDLPRTSVRHALEAERAARAAGLLNVRIGNRLLLSDDY